MPAALSVGMVGFPFVFRRTNCWIAFYSYPDDLWVVAAQCPWCKCWCWCCSCCLVLITREPALGGHASITWFSSSNSCEKWQRCVHLGTRRVTFTHRNLSPTSKCCQSSSNVASGFPATPRFQQQMLKSAPRFGAKFGVAFVAKNMIGVVFICLSLGKKLTKSDCWAQIALSDRWTTWYDSFTWSIYYMWLVLRSG